MHSMKWFNDMRLLLGLILFGFPVLLSAFYEGNPAFYQGELIDAFSIMDKGMDNPKQMLSLMNRGGVSKTLVAPRLIKLPDFLDKLKPYKKRLIPLFPLVNKWYRNDPSTYIHRVGKMSNRFDYLQGSGDLMLLALEPTFVTGKFDISFDDDRVRAAVRVVENNDWPLIIRMNTATLPPDRQRQRLDALNRWLSENSSVDVVLLHLAQLGITELEPLLKRHSRLYVTLSHANPEFEEPEMVVFTGGDLDPEWRRLMQAYPDRFIFAMGNFGKLDWHQDQYVNQIKWWRSGLISLPPVTADAIAHGNAKRLWKIQ